MVVVMMKPAVVIMHPGKISMVDLLLLGANLKSKKKNEKQMNVKIRISIIAFNNAGKLERKTWEVVIKRVAKAPKPNNKKKVKMAASLCL